jgi:cytochrome c biogenesis factor
MFYIATRHLHNLTWWIILFTGLWAVFRVWRGQLARLAWTGRERLAGLVFSSALATQFLIGLTLYFQSPVVRALLGGEAAGSDRRAAVFFGLIHPLMMCTAVVLGQVGFSVSKRLSDDRRKYRIAVICYTAALVVPLVTVLWAWLSYGRSPLP